MRRPSTDAIPQGVADSPAPSPDSAPTRPMGLLPYGYGEPAKTRPMLPASIAKLLASPAARPLASDAAVTRVMPPDADDAARTLGAAARAVDRTRAPVRETMALPHADGVPREILQRPPVAFTPPGEPPTDPIETIRTLVFPKRRIEFPLAPSASRSIPNSVPVVAAFAVGSIPPGSRNAVRARAPSPSPYLGSFDRSPYPRLAAPRPLSPAYAYQAPTLIAGSAAQAQQFEASSAYLLALATERNTALRTARFARAARTRVVAIALACLATLLVGSCAIAWL